MPDKTNNNDLASKIINPIKTSRHQHQNHNQKQTLDNLNIAANNLQTTRCLSDTTDNDELALQITNLINTSHTNQNYTYKHNLSNSKTIVVGDSETTTLTSNNTTSHESLLQRYSPLLRLLPVMTPQEGVGAFGE